MGKAIMNISLIDPVGGHGGMDFYDYGLAGGLANNDITIKYFTCNQSQRREIDNVSTVYSFGNVWELGNPALKIFSFLNGYLRSFRMAKKSNCTVVHLQFFSFDWLNVIVVFFLNRFSFKNVLTIHDISDFKSRNNNFFRNYILNSFDRIIVHNDFSYKELRRFYEKSNVFIVPHGNYLNMLSPVPPKDISDKKINLLFFGQIKKVKGLDVLLKALAIVQHKRSDIHLAIAGKVWHDDLNYYQNLITELNLEDMVSTNFSYIPNEEVSQFFQNADIVVLPYRKIYQSGVLLLSLSYGRPVITSDLEAFSEIMDNQECGITFKNNDYNDLADKLLSINFEDIEMWRKNGNILIKNYDWNSIGEKTISVYRS